MEYKQIMTSTETNFLEMQDTVGKLTLECMFAGGRHRIVTSDLCMHTGTDLGAGSL